MSFRRRPRTPRTALPSPGVLRRERRSLLEARERLLRDLGGLILEMYTRDRFNEELVGERCTELLELDSRLEEVEAVLDAATRRGPVRHCSCGTELPPFSRFCPQCGLPTDGSAPA